MYKRPVEELVLSIYRDAGGWEGLHVESGVHLALFALLMWGLLFDAPQPPHAFTSRFQDAPHDLCGEDGEFANARRVRLDERLASLRSLHGIGELMRAPCEVDDIGRAKMGVGDGGKKQWSVGLQSPILPSQMIAIDGQARPPLAAPAPPEGAAE